MTSLLSSSRCRKPGNWRLCPWIWRGVGNCKLTCLWALTTSLNVDQKRFKTSKLQIKMNKWKEKKAQHVERNLESPNPEHQVDTHSNPSALKTFLPSSHFTSPLTLCCPPILQPSHSPPPITLPPPLPSPLLPNPQNMMNSAGSMTNPKFCTICKRTHPVSNFSEVQLSTGKSGTQKCKQCIVDQQQQQQQ